MADCNNKNNVRSSTNHIII